MATPNSHVKNNILQPKEPKFPQIPNPHLHADTGKGKGKAVLQVFIQTREDKSAEPDQELPTACDAAVSSEKFRFRRNPYSLYAPIRWYIYPSHKVLVRIVVLAGTKVLLDSTVWWKGSELRTTFKNANGSPLRTIPDDIIETFTLPRLRYICARITSLPFPGCGERIADKEVWPDLKTATVGITHDSKSTTIHAVFQYPAAKIPRVDKLQPVRELSGPFAGITDNFIRNDLRCTADFGDLANVEEFFNSRECREHSDALAKLRGG